MLPCHSITKKDSFERSYTPDFHPQKERHYSKASALGINCSFNKLRFHRQFDPFRVEGGLRFLFWNLFGMSEVSDLDVKGSDSITTKVTGELLLALFSIISILVALNMLIAMMSNSYQHVAVSLAFMVECFPFNKVSGLKFRKFNQPVGTVRSGSTDTTQATERLVFVLTRRDTKERYWGQQFYQGPDQSKWGTFEGGPKYSCRTEPNRSGSFDLNSNRSFRNFGLNMESAHFFQTYKTYTAYCKLNQFSSSNDHEQSLFS